MAATAVQVDRSADPLVVATDVCKAFDGRAVLSKVSLNLFPTDIVLLRGENGSGKTTLINLLSGHVEPDSGRIEINHDGSSQVFAFPQPVHQRLNPLRDFSPEHMARAGL